MLISQGLIFIAKFGSFCYEKDCTVFIKFKVQIYKYKNNRRTCSFIKYIFYKKW